jgi:PiT family inorganic phosphate transporter
MLRFTTAATIASIFVILGAVVSGQNTTETLNALGGVNTLPAAFAVSLSAALAVRVMLKSGISVSISQTIVGAIIGWNVYNHQETDNQTLINILSCWVMCPIISGLIATALYFTVKKILHHSKLHILWQDFTVRLGMIFTTALGAYALGANNIADVVGVFVQSCAFQDINFGNLIHLSGIQVLFLIGAIAVSVGVFTYSQKVIKTVGKGVLTFSPAVAWIVILSQSLVLILFSSKGLENFLVSLGLPPLPAVPVSSTQAVIGAIVGIGLAKGGKEIKWSLVLKLVCGWITSPLMAFVLSYISLSFMENVFKQPVISPF